MAHFAAVPRALALHAGRSILSIMNVYLSHAHGDASVARLIATYLRGAGLSVWEESRLLPGDNWGEALGRALDQADAMVVLISPESLASSWVRKDVGYAISQPRFEGRLIPVIVRPTPLDLFPAALGAISRVQLVSLSGDPDLTRAVALAVGQIVEALAQAPGGVHHAAG